MAAVSESGEETPKEGLCGGSRRRLSTWLSPARIARGVPRRPYPRAQKRPPDEVRRALCAKTV